MFFILSFQGVASARITMADCKASQQGLCMTSDTLWSCVTRAPDVPRHHGNEPAREVTFAVSACVRSTNGRDLEVFFGRTNFKETSTSAAPKNKMGLLHYYQKVTCSTIGKGETLHAM